MQLGAQPLECQVLWGKGSFAFLETYTPGWDVACYTIYNIAQQKNPTF